MKAAFYAHRVTPQVEVVMLEASEAEAEPSQGGVVVCLIPSTRFFVLRDSRMTPKTHLSYPVVDGLSCWKPRATFTRRSEIPLAFAASDRIAGDPLGCRGRPFRAPASQGGVNIGHS